MATQSSGFTYYLYKIAISLSLYFLAGLNPIYADKDNDSLDQTLSKLVSFETVPANTQNNLEALNWVKSELSHLPLTFKNFESNGIPSLIITTRGDTKNPKLWLVAHIDVVPADKGLFTLSTQGDKFVGRGVLDMKYGIAAYIQFLKDLGPNLKDYDIGVMLTGDEELGGMNGVNYLLEKQGYTGTLGFLPDGGFDWQIEEDAKGLMWVKFKVNGVAGHGSRPWLGVNAINNLNTILTQLNTDFDQEKANAKVKDYYTTLNVGLISGGKAANEVPDYAEAVVDIRYTPDFDIKQFKANLNELIKKVPNAEYEILVSGNPNHLDLNKPEVKLFRDIAKKMYGIKVGSTKSHGATDARFFSAKGIPVIIVSPTGADIHSKNEWISKEDFHKFYNVFKAWAIQIGKTN